MDSFQAKGLPEDKTSPQMYTLCIDICNVLIEYKFNFQIRQSKKPKSSKKEEQPN